MTMESYERRQLALDAEIDHADEQTFSYQVNCRSGWRTVAVGLALEDIQRIEGYRQRVGSKIGIDFRFQTELS